MPTQGRKPRLSGAAKMKAAGKLPVLLGITPEQKAQLKAAAKLEGRPLTQYVVFHSLQTAARQLCQFTLEPESGREKKRKSQPPLQRGSS